jgi:hypothetical protein
LIEHATNQPDSLLDGSLGCVAARRRSCGPDGALAQGKDYRFTVTNPTKLTEVEARARFVHNLHGEF